MNKYSSETLSQIDWIDLINLLSEHSFFETTANIILHNNKTQAHQEIQNILEFTQQWIYAIEKHERLTHALFANLPPNALLDMLAVAISKESLPAIHELNIIACSVENFLLCFEHLPPFMTISFDINYIKKSSYSFLKKIRLLVAPNGEVSYDKIPEIKKIQERIAGIERTIREQIQRFISNPDTAKILQYHNFDIIYDRYVLPIRSDSYQHQLGTIIARSESGKTLFVEPLELKMMANTRLELLNKIDEIINTFCHQAFKLITINTSLFVQVLNTINLCDQFITRANFATNLHLSKPTLSNEKELILLDFFHPLISHPVKNDLYFTKNHHGMLISGPNMGGKTASLKAICIILLLAKNGFFVPAREASLYLFEDIFYFSDDLQNITSGESSFSGEVTKYLDAVSLYSNSKLFIFDEIFNTTSSEEASALAYSLFKEIAEQNGRIIASTHHQTLKTLIHQDANYVSAHVSFDIESNNPTYKLICGVPGSSYAINIFRKIMQKFALSPYLLKRAEHLLENKMIHYEALINDLNQKQIELDQRLQQVQIQKRELDNLKEAEKGLLQLQRDKHFEKLVSEIDAIKLNYLNKIKELNTEKAIDKITHEIKQVITPSNDQSILLNDSLFLNIESKIRINEFKLGKTYFCQVLNSDVVISKIDHKRKKAQVSRGNVSLSIPLATLSESKNKQTQNIKSSIKITETSYSLDARGMRLPAFEAAVDKLMAQLFNESFPYIEIIHGHGDGILKNWLLEFALKNPDLTIMDDESGNQGMTRLKLT